MVGLLQGFLDLNERCCWVNIDLLSRVRETNVDIHVMSHYSFNKEIMVLFNTQMIETLTCCQTFSGDIDYNS